MRGNTAFIPMASMAACATLKRQRDPVDTELSIHTISLASHVPAAMCGRPYVSQKSKRPSETRSNAKLDHIHMTTLADASPSIPQRPIACLLAVAASLLIRTNACLPLAMGLVLGEIHQCTRSRFAIIAWLLLLRLSQDDEPITCQSKKSQRLGKVFDVLDSNRRFLFSEQMTLFRRLYCLWPRVSLYLLSPPSFFSSIILPRSLSSDGLAQAWPSRLLRQEGANN